MSDPAAPQTTTIELVGVVGAGLMGSGIAEVCARAGLEVVIREVDSSAISAAETRIERSLERGVTSGKLTDVARLQALERMRITTSLDDLSDLSVGHRSRRGARECEIGGLRRS